MVHSSKKNTIDSGKIPSQGDTRFGLGLIMGFLIGSTSYFLFSTDQGKQLRAQMQSAWRHAASELPQLDELTIGDIKVAELVDLLLGKKVSHVKSTGLVIKETARPADRAVKLPKKFKGS
ncbi:MAG TPA: hypothetical protein PLM16_00245 [Candidatus Woesebacteria bacterium]|nr:hypothetical protein [Candidatus Woesebacteria bacterium]